MPRPPSPPPPANTNVHGAAAASAPSKEENVYIPAFISKRPFYAGDDDQADYLDHQRKKAKKEAESLALEASKAAKRRPAVPARTKWKKGACENCGAEGHKSADCLHRQRKKGAKWTGRDIQADDVGREAKTGWDAKRDRWYNYDPREHKKTVARYEEMEELKRLALDRERRQRLEDDGADGAIEGDDDSANGDKYAEEVDMGKHQPTSTKQLRIREDTAKYLLNLDLDSAKYDPKIRTLIDAGATADKASELFAQEGFMRGSGDAAAFESAQRYAWETQEQTGDSTQHLQANPTAGEFHRKQAAEKASRAKEEHERAMRERYGTTGQEDLPDEFRQMAVAETEAFVEYDELGMVKGAPRTMASSKYAEDVFPGNHSSVWGSWWDDFRWGYACCHSFIKNSYCTGRDGIEAWEESERQRAGEGILEQVEEKAGGDAAAAAAKNKVEEVARRREKEEQKKEKERNNPQSTEDFTGEVTEAEMEEYRRRKAASNDPMAKYLGKV